MKPDLDNFYLSEAEPNRSCFLALRDIILLQHENLTATIKYGSPCFCFGKKHFCYLWKDKKTKEPYLLMVDGNKINHPALESGKRTRMKILRVNPNEDLDIQTISAVLKEGIALRL